MELFKASRQWKERPADERFWSVSELYDICKASADASVTSSVRYGDLRAEAQDGEIVLLGKENVPAKVSNYAFGQLAARVKAPAEYLRRLPTTLAVQNLNHGLKEQRDPSDVAKLLLHKNGGFLARCLTGQHYQRIWNYEIASSLKALESKGWRTPPARPAGIAGERTRVATEADCIRGGKLGLSIQPGAIIAPAGVYAGDRDCFVFLVDDEHCIENSLPGGVPLARGFFCWNSEVGDKTFGVMTFLYESVCGNHIVWGAQGVKEFKIRHVGRARSMAFRGLEVQLREYANSSISEEQGRIERSQQFQIAGTKEETLAELLKFSQKKKLSLTEGNFEEAYVIAEQTPRYGNPRTPWAITQGLTEISQRAEHMDRRVRMDRDAGRIPEMAF